MQLYRSYIRLLGAQFKCRPNIFNPLFRNEASVKTLLAPSEAVMYKSLHVFSKLQQVALNRACTVMDKHHDDVTPEVYFDGRNKIIIYDAKYFISELNVISSEGEDYLLTQEFINVLSTSGFHYDASVLNSCAIERQVLSHGLTSFTAFQPSVTCMDLPLLILGNDTLLTETQKPQKNSVNQSEKPTEEILVKVVNRLTDSYLNFFGKLQDFSFYRKDIVFQNNFRGIKTKGISEYKKQIYILQVYGHLHFAKVKVEILKITHHLDDGTVRVRWRFSGLPHTKILSQLWKLKSLPWQEFCDQESERIDGFSIFSADKNGLVYKHFCDKMIPDDEKVVKSESIKTKILALLGVPGRSTDVGGMHAMDAHPSMLHSMKIYKRK